MAGRNAKCWRPISGRISWEMGGKGWTDINVTWQGVNKYMNHFHIECFSKYDRICYTNYESYD